MDEQKPKVQVIPANPFKRYKKEDDVNNGSVGIYCRVSTTEQKQLNSLSNQVSGLLKYLKEEGMHRKKGARQINRQGSLLRGIIT